MLGGVGDKLFFYPPAFLPPVSSGIIIPFENFQILMPARWMCSDSSSVFFFSAAVCVVMPGGGGGGGGGRGGGEGARPTHAPPGEGGGGGARGGGR